MVATMIQIRGWCDRHGRRSVKRLIAEHGPDASVRDIMRDQIGECPNRDSSQIQTRCDPLYATAFSRV